MNAATIWSRLQGILGVQARVIGVGIVVASLAIIFGGTTWETVMATLLALYGVTMVLSPRR